MIAYHGNLVFNNRDDLLNYMNSVLPERRLVSIDVETISLENTKPVGFSIAISPSEAFYFTLYPEMEVEMPWDIISNPDIRKIFHNSLFDLSAMDEYNMDTSNIEDTMIMAMLLNYPAKLIDLASTLDITIYSIGENLGKGMTTLDLPLAEVASKCCQHSKATFALYESLVEAVDKAYYRIEVSLVTILMRMSMRGVKIDQEVRNQLEEQFSEDAEYYEKLCINEGIMNPGSPQQVGFILAKRSNLLPIRRRKNNRTGKWEMKLSTKSEYLEKLSDPLASAVLSYRHTTKMLSTYLLPLRNYSRAYTRWHLDAITGRISSTKRNLQNMAYELRPMFVPDNGVFTDWDASQIELRVLAEDSQDEEMLRIFDTGGDIHKATADFMGIDRKIAKNVNFSMIYGATDQTIMETAHIQNIKRARQLKEMWFEKYGGAARWIQLQQEKGWEDGYVETMYGRKIKLPIGKEDKGEIDRKSVNYPIQGSAAEIIKRVMLKCKELPLVLQVHDELIADGDVQDEVKELHLEDLAPFRQPYNIQTMERWQ